jgi:adenine-specific DNA-methyltransferase
MEINALARTFHESATLANGAERVRGNVPSVVSRADSVLSRVDRVAGEFWLPTGRWLPSNRVRGPYAFASTKGHRLIKYLGSKRALVPVLGEVLSAVEATTAVDLFTGTTRVAQEFKRRGARVIAVDLASYSKVLADCYIGTDVTAIDKDAVVDALAELNALPGKPGYVTETFCEQARYFQPKNGVRIDAIRDRLEAEFRSSPLFPILLTALMLAADRVDSTAGLQMAYLKQWAPRAYHDLELRMPELLAGQGEAIIGDATAITPTLPAVDLAYLDPPYNQHRYFTNYHVWESLVRWDKPSHYGVACKRADAREPGSRSAFDSKKTMPSALADLVASVRANVVVVSYNNESWVAPEQIEAWLKDAGHERVSMLSFDFKRYVGAQIGIHNPSGVKVGKVSHLRNTEFVFVAGPADRVAAATAVAQG